MTDNGQVYTVLMPIMGGIMTILLGIIAYFLKQQLERINVLATNMIKLQVEFGSSNAACGIRHKAITDKLSQHETHIEDHESRIQKNTTEIEVIKEKISK